MILSKTTPYLHQLEALARSQDRDSFALLMEAGTGKTKIIIDNAAYLYAKGEIESLIVLAPNGVHRNWLEEIAIHLHEDVPYVAAYYHADGLFQQKQLFEAVAASKGPLRILTFNIECLSSESGIKVILPLIKERGRKCMVVIDESQRIKTPSSKRTKRAYRVGDPAAYRRILTGTPVSQGLQDLFSQFRFLDWRIIGCKTYAEFKAQYCVQGGYQESEIISYRNVDMLKARLAPYVFEKDKKDCLDLPKQTWITREVELSIEQRRHYKELKLLFESELKGHNLQAALPGVRMLRLRQILSGFFPTPDNHSWINLPCPRLEVCADLVEEASRGKVIVWCHFHADIQNVCAALQKRGIGFLQYYGGISDDQRAANLATWRTSRKHPVLVGTAATGGVGLTLIEADTMIFFSHNYSYEERTQAESRNHRAGQTKPVTYYSLVAKGTADVRMMKVVRNKGEIANMIKNMDRTALLELFQDV